MIELIRDFLNKSSRNSLSFFEYMQWALYASEKGYYASNLSKFGTQGDFTTASELTPLYAQLWAIQCAEVMQRLGYVEILELGPGSGKFAIDLLQALAALGIEVKHYYLFEISSNLRARQQEYCRQFEPWVSKITWLEELPAQESFSGIIFAHEVLDAMPVHQFIKKEGKFWEVFVEINKDHLSFAEPKVASSELQFALENLETRLGSFPEGFQSEVNLELGAYLASIDRFLKAGLVFFVDYGYSEREYYQPSRSKGTLMAYHKHEANEDILSRPGEQDITAHVDFSRVAEVALEQGFTLEAYTQQGLFLANLRSHFSAEISPEASQYLRRLMHPAAMGEIFKVMLLQKKLPTSEWRGFLGVNQRNRL